MDKLSHDELASIFDFLGLPDAGRCLPVSRLFNGAVSTPVIWTKFCPVLLPGPVIPPEAWKSDVENLRRILKQVEKYSLIARVYDASSSDHTSQSSLETVNTCPTRFWSSTGRETTEGIEYVTYELMSAACVVTSVDFAFYRADYQRGDPLYPSKRVQVRCGWSPTDWYYISPEQEVEETDSGQCIILTAQGLPCAVPCHYVRVDFIGKKTAQESDQLYYCCLSSVVVKGHQTSRLPIGSLGCIFESQMCTTSHFLKFLRKFEKEKTKISNKDIPLVSKENNPVKDGKPHRLMIPLPQYAPVLHELLNSTGLRNMDWRGVTTQTRTLFLDTFVSLIANSLHTTNTLNTLYSNNNNTHEPTDQLTYPAVDYDAVEESMLERLRQSAFMHYKHMVETYGDLTVAAQLVAQNAVSLPTCVAFQHDDLQLRDLVSQVAQLEADSSDETDNWVDADDDSEENTEMDTSPT